MILAYLLVLESEMRNACHQPIAMILGMERAAAAVVVVDLY